MHGLKPIWSFYICPGFAPNGTPGRNGIADPRQDHAHSSVRGAFFSSPGVATAVCSAKSRRDDLIIAQYGSAHTSCTGRERRYSAEPVLGTMGQEDQSRKGRLILMPHRHVSCLVHVVFSTSGRQPTIREQMRDRLHA